MPDTITYLRALLAKATLGPWHQKDSFEIECPHGEDEGMTCYDVCDADENTAYIQVCGMETFAAPNSALIVAAVNALPMLLDVVEAVGRWLNTQDGTLEKDERESELIDAYGAAREEVKQ